MRKKKKRRENDLVVITDSLPYEKYLELVLLKLSHMEKVRMVCTLHIERYRTMSLITGLINGVGFTKKAIIKQVECKVGNRMLQQNEVIFELDEIIKNKRKYG